MESPNVVDDIADVSSSQTDKPIHEAEAAKGYDYEVFISFRGTDTRTGITDFLYTSLTDAGVRAFRDDEELRVGKDIGPDLLQAIDQSKISIPVFSVDYASSPWCLKEVAQIVECMEKKGQIVMPIFYHVEPSDVRYQIGCYKKAFEEYERKQRYDDKTIRTWKDALNKVATLKGWAVAVVESVRHGGQPVKEVVSAGHEGQPVKEVKEVVSARHEGQLVKEVVKTILSELKKAYLAVSDFLVGVDSTMKEVLGIIDTGTDDVKTVGIHGIGGIGKTALAKVVYNHLSRDFANCCFLPDIRDTSNLKGIVHLQKQLISDLSKRACLSIGNKEEGMRTIKERFSSKKILLLLDDIDDESQLTALLGGQGCFGRGSLILITTRNATVLRAFQVKLLYHVGALDFDRSLRLFSKHAFRSDYPPPGKLERSKEIVEIAQGLPSLLEVMGSTLSVCGQTEEMWGDYLEKWRKGPIEKIRNKLMISYEALDLNQRQIFLDIACFFIGYDKDTVAYMWKDCGLSPTEGLQTLQLMSLIKIGEDNKIWMNNQLKELGREIVSQESGQQLGKQSRLWNHKDALNVLLSNKKNEKLQALRLMFENSSECSFTLDGFAALPKLRFLHVDSRHFTDEVDRLCSEATILWNNKSLVTSLTNNFMGNKQLLPDLRWFSWHNFPQRILQMSNFSLINVVILDFSRSKITHDWSGWKHVKRAVKLKVLNLSGCDLLTKTPDFSGFPKFERLILEKCEKLTRISSSIGKIESLVFLNLNFCGELHSLPPQLGELSALTELLLDGTSIREIPDWCVMKSLKKLSLDATPITHLPESIGALTNLESLSLNWCSNMGRLPPSFEKLRSLTELDLLETGITELPDSMESLVNLKDLKLSGCYGSGGISALPKLPISLISLVILSPSLITIPDLSSLINLKQLLLCMGVPDISGPPELAQPQEPMPWWIGSLSKLEVLTLTIPQMTKLSPELGALPRLRSLHLSGCHALECIPQIPSSVSKIQLIDCPSLTTLDISDLKKLSELYAVATPLQDLSEEQLSDKMLGCKIRADYEHDLQAQLRSKMLEQHGLTKNIVGLRTREMDRGYFSALGKYKKMFL